MGKIVHISQFNPRKNDGGVAQFARDLKSAIPELEFLYHGSAQHPWNLVESINEGFLRDGKLDASTTVIADGYYALGLQGKVERLIIAAHGTYAGWLRDNLMNPLPDMEGSYAWLTAAAEAQERAFQQADQIVSVSSGAQRELWDFYDIDSELILNGIDTELYAPDAGRTGIVEVAGDDVNKGADIIAQLRSKSGLKINPLGFEGEKPRRWRGRDILIMPSRHEAGPYAQLEAMAKNIKIVSYYNGFFKGDCPESLAWLTYDHYWGTYARMLEDAVYSDPRDTRSWVLENATIELFRKKWGEFIHGPN